MSDNRPKALEACKFRTVLPSLIAIGDGPHRPGNVSGRLCDGLEHPNATRRPVLSKIGRQKGTMAAKVVPLPAGAATKHQHNQKQFHTKRKNHEQHSIAVDPSESSKISATIIHQHRRPHHFLSLPAPSP